MASAPSVLASLVLFDLDDTLFDHSGCVESGLTAVAQEFPALRRRPIPELRVDYLAHLNSVHARIMAGELDQNDARVERYRLLFASCGAHPSDSELRRAIPIYRAAYAASHRTVAGAVPLLRHLHEEVGAKVVVVTNNATEEQVTKLSGLGLNRYVDALVTSEAVGVLKPDPQIFAAAIAQGGATRDAAVMVGDSWEADVMGARSAGIRPVWFNRYRVPPPSEGPVEVLYTLEPTDAATSTILGRPPGTARLL